MDRSRGGHSEKRVAVWNRLLAAGVRIFGRETFTLLAAVDGFPSHPCSAEAVDRPQQHEDTNQRRRDVNAPRHSPTIYQILWLESRRPGSCLAVSGLRLRATAEPRAARVRPPRDPHSI